MITTSSYYKDKILISNAQDTAPNSNLLGNRTSLEVAIDKYEGEVLIRLFGYDLFKLFKEQFDIDATTGVWTIKGAANAKWGELLNGKEYTVSGLDVTWRGLVFSDGGTDNLSEQSLLAYYVFSKWTKENEISHSGTGFQSEVPKNSIRVSSRSTWASAFNDFYDIAVGGYNLGFDFQHDHYPFGLRSLYQFIADQNAVDSTTYPNWDGECFKLVNRHGL